MEVDVLVDVDVDVDVNVESKPIIINFDIIVITSL